MRIHLEEEESTELPIVPMIDVAFLLLIFFLIATTFKKKEKQVPVELPYSAYAVNKTAAADPLIVSIDREGRKFVNGTPVTTAELHERLREAAKNTAQVRIDGDKNARYADVIEVIELCQFEGLRRVGFKTALEK